MNLETLLKNRENVSPLRLCLRCVLSYIAVLSLRYNYELGGGLETDYTILNLVSRISNSFTQDTYLDVIVFFVMLAALSLAVNTYRKTDRWAMALAVVFAVLRTLALACWYAGGWKVLIADTYQLFMAFLCTVGYTVQHYAALAIIYYLMDNIRVRKEKPITHPMRTAAILIFLSWLPWLFMNYPGSMSMDSIGQYHMWVGTFFWWAHHPPLSTAIMGICYDVGRLIWDDNFGIFLYCLLQAVCGTTVFAYSLSELYKIGMSRRMYIAGLVFFCVMPMWGCSVQWAEKDFLYAVVFMLDIVFLIPVIHERRCTWRDAVKISCATLIAVLLRKTGTYELIPVLICTAIWLRRGGRERMVCAALAAYILSSCVNNVLYPALGIVPGSVKEAMNIPFMQTARYCLTYPDEVTEEEFEAIDAVLDVSLFDRFEPDISDPIKNGYKENNAAMPAYLKVWFRMLLKHPLSYLETAYLKSWRVFTPAYGSMDPEIWSSYAGYNIEPLQVHRVFGVLPTKLFDCWREIWSQLPVLNLFASAGAYTWALAIFVVQLLRKHKYSALLLTVPGIMNVLICVASPLNGATRYELPLIAMIHLLLVWTLIYSKEKE